ncbi:MAG: DEAD/DEAH box helicase [Spirochaetes bacterium]|nr:MAG: DEAD/DEAH box helicase [Spirochaetota bacterium]
MKLLRQHQIEALEAINNINEGIIHLPTGTGKTFIQANAIVNNLESNKVFVILSPRILLTNQLYSEVKSILLQNIKNEK